MRRVKVTLPATITNLGAGVGALGLAVGLHVTVEIIERADTQLVVETSGEGAGRYGIGIRHPVVVGVSRLFQQVERAVLGMTIRIDNHIPYESGLGAEIAPWIAGIIAGNVLLDSPLKRETLVKFTAEASRRPDHTVTAMLGGLTVTRFDGDALVYRSLPLQPAPLVIVVPEISDYAERLRAIPSQVALADAQLNLTALPLLLDALRTGDYTLLHFGLEDRLAAPSRRIAIVGYDAVSDAAMRAGARGVAISGTGPAVAAFAPAHHREIAQAMVGAFAEQGVVARAFTVPMDTQGVVISAARSG